MTKARHDAVLGSLVFDEGLNWYEGKQTADGERFTVRVSLDAFPTEDDAISTARTVFPTLVSAIGSAKRFARDHLLELKNSEWLNAGERPVSADAFVAALKLHAIVIYVDADSEFHFTCGNLFARHTVLVCWNKTEGFNDADIAG